MKNNVKNCKKGNPCGNSCISKKRQCRKKAQVGTVKAINSLAKEILSVTSIIDANNAIKANSNTNNNLSKFSTIEGTEAKKAIKDFTKESLKLYGTDYAINSIMQLGGDNNDKYNTILINRGLIELIKESTSDKSMQTIAIKSPNNKVEALGQYTKQLDSDTNSLYVDYIVTSPKNLDKNNKDYVRGGGKNLVIAMAQKSVELGGKGALSLNSAKTAVKFYEKLGFTLTNDITKGENHMILSEESANRLLNEKQ